MKTWEMIKELSENPEKKFVNEVGAKVTHSGLGISWDDGKVIPLTNIFMICEWKEVKDPVSFMEAVASGKKIRPVSWHEGTNENLSDLFYELSDYEPEDVRKWILGEWYIED